MYTLGSLYDHFQHIRDPRKAKGKRYSLVTLLALIFLAKLCGKDTPVEIADWAKNEAEALAQLLGLKRAWMPHHNTYRRVFQDIFIPTEFERLMESDHQQTEADGDLLVVDGKAMRGTCIGEQRAVSMC